MARIIRLFLLPLLVALGGPAAGGAEIRGRIALPKPPPAPVKQQRYEVVTSGGKVALSPALAVVYLEGDFPAGPPPAPARMIQKDQTFLPALLPVQVGTRVEFPNLDEIYHNIFSFSPAKRFDLGRYRPEDRPIPAQVFDRPGVVTLRCDIHVHMRAIVLVLATPHFTVTDEAGNFRLTGLPPGSYTLKAWIDSAETRTRPVVLAADDRLEVNLP